MMATSNTTARVVVTGAGGFIGWHLTNYLKARGYWVRGVDIKPPRFAPSSADEFVFSDLRDQLEAIVALDGCDEVYALAADMGGMGFISSHHSGIMHNNLLININTLDAAKLQGISRYFFASSACIYPIELQKEANIAPLREQDAYPANPQGAYGWEKLTAERMCAYYREDCYFETRIARFHNVFGPNGTWAGGREKAPAALCRKIARASDDGVIEIWGDGKQTRSFLYIDDCLDGIYALMRSDYRWPVNIGSDRIISIDDLAQMIASIAGKRIIIKHVPGPQGVRGRNSDNTLAREVLGWEPTTKLEDGLGKTYEWIAQQVEQNP